MESIATLVWLRNGISSWNVATRSLFGANVPGCVTKQFHHGTLRLFDALDGAGYTSCEEFIDSHGYIRLFYPFETHYEDLRSRILRDRSYGVARQLNIIDLQLFSSRKLYCPECASLELRTLGFAYAHRTHQVIGVITCPIHGVRLGTVDHPDWCAIENKGILLANRVGTKVGGLQVSTDKMPQQDEHCARFGRWVHAAFAGTLLPTPRYELWDIINAYLNDGFKDCNTEKTAGRLYDSPNHSVEALHFLSELFDSPEAYNIVVASHVRSERPLSYREQRRLSLHTLMRSLTFKKDLLKIRYLNAIALKHGVPIGMLQRYLYENPALFKRRTESLGRIARQRYRTDLTAAITASPALTRSGFEKHNSRAYGWLRKNDGAWIDKQFAQRRSRKARQNYA